MFVFLFVFCCCFFHVYIDPGQGQTMPGDQNLELFYTCV